jgi:NitT/TauT family transport system permease protein
VILPPVTEIVPAFFVTLTGPLVWPHLWVTLQETVIGFVISSAAAFLIGVLIALIPPVRAAVFPLVLSMQSTPRSALAPVMISWFGFGMSSKIALAVLIAFFPVLINTVAGLSVTGENELLLMRSLESSKAQTFFHLRLPNAMPVIFPGLKASATFALVGAVFAELLGSQVGMGQLIKSATFQLRMADVFAYLAFLSIVGIAMVGIMSFIESKVIFWSIEREP